MISLRQALSCFCCCYPVRNERQGEIELNRVPVTYVKKPQDKNVQVQSLSVTNAMNQKLVDRTNQTFQLKVTMGGKWDFLEGSPGEVDFLNKKISRIAGKVYEFFFTFLDSKGTAFEGAVKDLKSKSASLAEQYEEREKEFEGAVLKYKQLLSEVEKLKSKSIARVVIELPEYQEQIHTNLIRLKDRSSNPNKLTAIVLVLDRCYMATGGKKNEILPLEDKTYLERLLNEEACGSIYNENEGTKTRRANCCSRTSMVSIYDAQISEAEGVSEELMEFEMTVFEDKGGDRGGMNIRDSRSRQLSGVFVLGLPEENQEDEFVFKVGEEGLEFKNEEVAISVHPKTSSGEFDENEMF